MATLTKIKAKLDKETAGHIDTKAHINDLNQQLSDLSQLVSRQDHLHDLPMTFP